MFTQGPSISIRVLLAVVLSLALMIVDHRQHHLESVRSILSTLTYPLQFVANLPIAAGYWVSETFATRTRLQEENRELHRENLLLQGRQQKLAALEAENMRLRDLLDSSFKLGDRVLIAELIAVDMDPYRQLVLLNKGSSSGIYKGQPVLHANAVMGQVVHVNRFTASVLMITDASHALPIQVNRNGLRTVAIGTGRINELELPNLPNNADIEVGDLLVTSGLGGRFPSGYPVATVTSIRREPGEPFALIKAQPSAHLERAREALLVWTLTPPDRDDTDVTPGQSAEQPPPEEP
ncbi:rod shape-determining protein MreC [Sedimenticola sp.]|uniref:rod shape-determining protein MreC n=1 Tax=Sedimenticola sp. TaxID=1940285 RepID=UPI00258DC846|nr:rod shape-determining protein MreC [Sedimenticola sp.]MCW8903533.1 rod shape-determining protein MreC [Sedimenticola sp.]